MSNETNFGRLCGYCGISERGGSTTPGSSDALPNPLRAHTPQTTALCELFGTNHFAVRGGGDPSEMSVFQAGLFVDAVESIRTHVVKRRRLARWPGNFQLLDLFKCTQAEGQRVLDGGQVTLRREELTVA